ncbi:MAG TPA: Crp/Fnr family transcriptional regulator [Chloroflexota bacterium]|nr:Crp/Fnr family transcriptional regulator [Chloroflexota bacterium]
MGPPGVAGPIVACPDPTSASGRATRSDTPRPVWDAARRATFLRAAPLFSALPPGTLARVAQACRAHQFSRGEYVFLQGDPARSLNLLASGRLKVVRETDDGKEVIVRLVEPGELFGAAGGWGEASYPASAVAQDDSVVLRLPAAELERLITSEPAFALAVVCELGARLREAEARVRELQTERVERRIARVLMRLASKTGRRTARGIEIGIPLTRQDLAELAGTTLSTASRTLSAWDQQHLVEAGRARVLLLQPHALVALAEELVPPDTAPAGSADRDGIR